MTEYTQLKRLANESFADLPDWHPEFGLTEQQKNFSMAAGPQVVLALIEERDRLAEQVEALRAERDHADRLLGMAERLREAAETRRKYAEDTLAGQDKWLLDTTLEMGYPNHEVFDVVWADTRRDALRYRFLAKRFVGLTSCTAITGIEAKTLEEVHAMVDANMSKEPDHD